jgi:dTDP-D-glucose 4,6-dehydratase
MKLFVTGGAGFIGSNFIRHVLGLRKSYSIVNYDKLTYAGNLGNLDSVANDSHYRFCRGDICDPAAAESAMRDCDAVVHFAAESHVDRSIYDPSPAIETNVKGTFVLLQVAKKLGIHRFVHISTDEVYGDIPPAAEPLPIYGDGMQQRDWLHVEDNCRGILAVLERGRIGEVYNLGGIAIEENLTIAKRLLRVMEKPETLITYVKDRPGHDRRYALDCKKVETEIGWKPAIGLDEGLRQTIAWYKANPEWLAGVRGGEYQSYYEKYYENRNPSLNAISHERRRTLQN